MSIVVKRPPPSPCVRVGVGSGKASYVRWPQKYLTASLQQSRAERRAAIVTSAVVPNDGFPVGAFVVVVSVVRAAKTSGGVVDKPKDAGEDQFVSLRPLKILNSLYFIWKILDEIGLPSDAKGQV